MKKLFKPASLLFYFFMVIVFFFAGVYYAGITGAAEGQGLAGGAIVLGYGVIAAFIALLVSFIIAYYTEREVIVRMNQILGIILLIFIAITAFRIIARERSQAASEPSSQLTNPKPVPTTVAPAVDIPVQEEGPELGLGFFSPDFYNESIIYFYGNPNFEKAVSDHTPSDSIKFRELDGHRFDISYAPPWLVPEHMKMDYEILHFRIKSINQDFVEIIVNKTNQRNAYVDRHAGRVTYWPDFLLNVHSVEFPQNQVQTVRIKPLNYAGQVNSDFVFMRPLRIQDDWMEVELQDQNFQKVGEGWIQWKNENELLIEYSLLS